MGSGLVGCRDTGTGQLPAAHLQGKRRSGSSTLAAEAGGAPTHPTPCPRGPRGATRLPKGLVTSVSSVAAAPAELVTMPNRSFLFFSFSSSSLWHREGTRFHVSGVCSRVNRVPPPPGSRAELWIPQARTQHRKGGRTGGTCRWAQRDTSASPSAGWGRGRTWGRTESPGEGEEDPDSDPGAHSSQNRSCSVSSHPFSADLFPPPAASCLFQAIPQLRPPPPRYRSAPSPQPRRLAEGERGSRRVPGFHRLEKPGTTARGIEPGGAAGGVRGKRAWSAAAPLGAPGLSSRAEESSWTLIPSSSRPQTVLLAAESAQDGSRCPIGGAERCLMSARPSPNASRCCGNSAEASCRELGGLRLSRGQTHPTASCVMATGPAARRGTGLVATRAVLAAPPCSVPLILLLPGAITELGATVNAPPRVFPAHPGPI